MAASIAFVLILILILLQIFLLLRGESEGPSTALRGRILRGGLLVSGILLVGEILRRSWYIRFPALTNTFEALLFFSAAVFLILFFLYPRLREVPTVLFAATVTGAVLLALASSPLIPEEMQPPIPALRSSWLLLHVSFSFVGEAFFVVAFAAALVRLFGRREELRRKADRITYLSVSLGYMIFTAGALIFGMVWAKQAWGSYWSWDPKETWALITWLTYTLYLHLRLVKGLRGRLSAVLAIIGFLLTLFTFFGVNYLLPSLHSYV
jgi:ABC-type transport system involved in cytochrome c biogenesis permease subunit